MSEDNLIPASAEAGFYLLTIMHPGKWQSFLTAFLLEMGSWGLDWANAARSTIYNLDQNERLFDNMIDLHMFGRCSPPQGPFGKPITPVQWDTWVPQDPLTNGLRASLQGTTLSMQNAP